MSKSCILYCRVLPENRVTFGVLMSCGRDFSTLGRTSPISPQTLSKCSMWGLKSFCKVPLVSIADITFLPLLPVAGSHGQH